MCLIAVLTQANMKSKIKDGDDPSYDTIETQNEEQMVSVWINTSPTHNILGVICTRHVTWLFLIFKILYLKNSAK